MTVRYSEGIKAIVFSIFIYFFVCIAWLACEAVGINFMEPTVVDIELFDWDLHRLIKNIYPD